jgi:6-pyruvoyltetrahydropterin/6-carboxytetrahydropterin synthase
MTYTVSKDIEFDAGHRVPNHKSKCRNPHGHRYRLRVTITGDLVSTPGSSSEGMLADFGDLKTFMTYGVHDVLDHGFIVYEADRVALRMFDYAEGENFKLIIVPFIPTAENLAKWCWDQLVTRVESIGFKMHLVELWETPTSLATYKED